MNKKMIMEVFKMGYTVSWERPKKIKEDILIKAGNDFKQLLDENVFNFELGNGLGEGTPTINKEKIVFNGFGQENSCESFVFEANIEHRHFLQQLNHKENKNDLYYDFCKTRRLPYDLAVKTMLLILKYYLDDYLRISSDGIVGNNNFKIAKRIIKNELGYEVKMKITDN
jgi:hypothetical protein